MAPVCNRCGSANPAGATHCYFDGAALDDRAAAPAAPAAGRPFPTPFVFPSGRACRTFAELARACLDEWDVARDLLRRGFLEQFLGGRGAPT
jgi:hypothetical protein